MNRSLTLTLLGGLVAGSALAWFRPPAAAPGGPARTSRRDAAVRPGSLASQSSSPLVKAWRNVTGGQGGFGQRLALMAMVMRAASEDMPVLLAQSRENAFARELLLLRWVEIDASAAGDWIAPGLRDPDAPGVEATSQDVQRVLSAWAKRDPDAAIAKVKSEAGGFTASMYHNQIVVSVLAEDMERGLKLVAEARAQVTPGLTNYVDTAWVSKDPAKAARLLSEMPESDFRNDSLVRAIGEVGAKDMAAGLALLEKFPALASNRQMWDGSGSRDSRASLFENWAKQDMTAMIGFVNDHAQGPTRSAMKEAIAKVIGEGDPKLAFTWAAENLSGDRRHNVVNSLLTKLARDNPTEALDYVVSLPPGSAFENAMRTFAQTTSQTDPASALARVRALPESPTRARLIGTSYATWYARDPAAALGELTREPPDSVPKEIWGNLGRSSGTIAGGLKQLDQIPPERAPEFVRGLFSNYQSSNTDISQTAKSLDQLKDPAQRSQAIQGMMESWSWRDPAAASQWAATLPSPAERQHVRTILETRTTHFPPDVREKLLAPLK